MLLEINHNPDVLSTLANLSSDEIFTPPKVVNEVLDLLPSQIWSDPEATFLDPCTKSGVFLREMARRLNEGLESQIPDQQERIDHIFQKQIFGVAITQITALLSRRSVYTSKTANGKYSIVTAFKKPDGNIKYDRTQHNWKDGNCTFCGASQEEYDRSDNLETHAYQFLHTHNPMELFDMKFDVIIGNPPYQMGDGGGTGKSAKPIYHHFVRQAKALKPKHMVMIIPARWYTGGKGLDSFRDEMIKDKFISHIIDYPDEKEVFPGVNVAGGICIFHRGDDSKETCRFESRHGGVTTVSKRKLDQFDVLIRDQRDIDILNKVVAKDLDRLSQIVLPRNPFGISSNARFGNTGEIFVVSSKGDGFLPRSEVQNNQHLIDQWKVLVSKTTSENAGGTDKDGRRRLLSRVEVLKPGQVCSESYLVVGDFNNEAEARSLQKYLKTCTVRFLIATILQTQNITRDRFEFVPKLDFTNDWTDESLAQLLGLTSEDVEHINAKIKPME